MVANIGLWIAMVNVVTKNVVRVREHERCMDFWDGVARSTTFTYLSTHYQEFSGISSHPLHALRVRPTC